MGRAEQVKKIRDKARAVAQEEYLKKKAAEPVASVRAPKSGCSFCSHCRKKIKEGVAFIKKVIVEG